MATTPIVISTTGTSPAFLTNDVKIGDELVITDIANATAIAPLNDVTNFLVKSGAIYPFDQLLVTSVPSETSVAFLPYTSGVALDTDGVTINLGDPGTGEYYTFDVVRHLTKDQQAALIAATATAYGSKRVIYVWPPAMVWEEGGPTLDGSALAAALAAAKSAYPAQQSFTNLGFPGPYQLMYSNTYFTPAQLDTLTAAGVFVVVQNALGAEVYARHQKTTSTASIQEQEWSITTAVDKLSIDCYDLVKPFIGKYNISQDLLTQLEDIISQYLFSAKSRKAAYCGSLIIDYTSLAIRANLEGANQDLTPGTIEISVTIEVGYPANYINVKLYIV
jgi:hypothetical protein